MPVGTPSFVVLRHDPKWRAVSIYIWYFIHSLIFTLCQVSTHPHCQINGCPWRLPLFWFRHWLLPPKTISTSSLGPHFKENGCKCVMNVFHGYSHNWACQKVNHPQHCGKVGSWGSGDPWACLQWIKFCCSCYTILHHLPPLHLHWSVLPTMGWR